jgi:hypothetical protein
MYALATIAIAIQPAAMTQGSFVWAMTSFINQATTPVAHISVVFHPGFIVISFSSGFVI